MRRSSRARASTSSATRGCSRRIDRKSTRLNSSHLVISYAVFCLKKKKEHNYLPVTGSTNCPSHGTNHTFLRQTPLGMHIVLRHAAYHPEPSASRLSTLIAANLDL